MTEGKQRRRGIGSINKFATLGNKASEPQSVEESESQSAQTISSLDVQELKQLDTQPSNSFESKESDSSSAQESKRLIQVSEEELKRLMVEALQSQNTQTSKQQEKPKRLRQTVYLEPDLHKQVRHRIADTGEDISDVVNLALRQLLQQAEEGM